MHTVELMDQAIATARKLGYSIRQEWLGGVAGGACEVAGRKWLFIDLSLSTDEQLEQICRVLEEDPGIGAFPLAPALARRLGFLPRKVA
jgi:hypothetical protein